MAWNPAAVDAPMIRQAWDIQDRYGFSWWDCLIVAAAKAQDCRYLLTEDLQHGQELDGVSVLSPFKTEPVAFPEISVPRSPR